MKDIPPSDLLFGKGICRYYQSINLLLNVAKQAIKDAGPMTGFAHIPECHPKPT